MLINLRTIYDTKIAIKAKLHNEQAKPRQLQNNKALPTVFILEHIQKKTLKFDFLYLQNPPTLNPIIKKRHNSRKTYTKSLLESSIKFISEKSSHALYPRIYENWREIRGFSFPIHVFFLFTLARYRRNPWGHNKSMIHSRNLPLPAPAPPVGGGKLSSEERAENKLDNTLMIIPGNHPETRF